MARKMVQRKVTYKPNFILHSLLSINLNPSPEAFQFLIRIISTHFTIKLIDLNAFSGLFLSDLAVI